MARNYSKWSFYQPVRKKPVRQRPPTYAGPSPYGPPRPPDAAYIDRLFPDFQERTEPQWEELLNARVKPYETAIKKVNTQQLGQSEFVKEQSEAANERLGLGFANLFTGGKAGAEGQQFAKENFGSEFMGLQAVAIAHQQLTKITSDWNERDWEISSQYQKAMAEIPGLKEQMRESINRADTDEYTRKFNYANLLLDEAWNVYDANAKQYNTDQQLLAAKKMAAEAAGLKGYTTRKDAVAEAAKFADDTGTIWNVRQNKDGSFSAFNTGKKKPGSSKASDEIKWRNAALREASDLTKAYGIIYKAQKVKGVWTAVSTGKKTKSAAAKGGKGAKLETAQGAEAALIKEFYGNRDKYLGKPDPSLPPGPDGKPQMTGGMTYNQAYQELLDYALSVLAPYGRSNTYVANWVRQRLSNLYPGQSPTNAKPRGG